MIRTEHISQVIVLTLSSETEMSGYLRIRVPCQENPVSVKFRLATSIYEYTRFFGMNMVWFLFDQRELSDPSIPALMDQIMQYGVPPLKTLHVSPHLLEC